MVFRNRIQDERVTALLILRCAKDSRTWNRKKSDWKFGQAEEGKFHLPSLPELKSILTLSKLKPVLVLYRGMWFYKMHASIQAFVGKRIKVTRHTFVVTNLQNSSLMKYILCTDISETPPVVIKFIWYNWSNISQACEYNKVAVFLTYSWEQIKWHILSKFYKTFPA